jgi:hypothetical protein
MLERKLHRCDPGDPGQCQSGGKYGQCPYLSVEALAERGLLDSYTSSEVEGIHFCPRHHGETKAKKQAKDRLHDYRLQVWQERVNEFAESANVKNLRGEIGVTRLILQSVLDMAEDPQGLMMYSTRIASLVRQIESLVKSCDRLDARFESVLDEASAMKFASQVVKIISEFVKEPETIDKISEGIIDALAEVTKYKDE